MDDKTKLIKEIEERRIRTDYIKSHIIRLYQNCKVVKTDKEIPSEGDCVNITINKPIISEDFEAGLNNLAGMIEFNNRFIKDIIKLDDAKFLTIFCMIV